MQLKYMKNNVDKCGTVIVGSELEPISGYRLSRQDFHSFRKAL
jgi:hypothetical protein